VYRSDLTDAQRGSKERPSVTFWLSSPDRADLVSLLDETDARHSYAEMCTALTVRNTTGEVCMAPGSAETLLEWVRARARRGRSSSATPELERALLLGRVALAVQRALAKQSSIG
jgi:hypothetical protein